MTRLAPSVIVTTTAFAATAAADEPTPLDDAGVPVLQAIVATTRRAAWVDSPRGLGAADLAMHVVLPELDGRVLAGVVAFKAPSNSVDGLAFAGVVNRPEPDRIDAVADRVAALVRLQTTPRQDRRIAVLLPDYPGAPGRTGYAVGLDVPASVNALLADLAEAGYAVSDAPPTSKELLDALNAGDVSMPVASYRSASWPSSRSPSAKRLFQPGARRKTIPMLAMVRSAFAQRHSAMSSSRCRRSAAVRTIAAPTITIRRCHRVMRCSPSACGCATPPTSTPSSTWARTARWNGCRARPWR